MPATKDKTEPVEPAIPSSNHAEPVSLPIAEDGAAILALDDREVELVQVPEWNLAVTLQSLTGDERDTVDAWVIDHRDESGDVKQAGFRAFIVAMTAVNSKGDLLFTPDQVAALGRKNHNAIIRLANVALRLSKMQEADVDEAADDLGKGQSSASGTS